MSLTSTSPTTVSQNPHHLRNAGCTANWATSRPRSTSRPTTLLHRTHHPGSPHTGRRHETRDGSLNVGRRFVVVALRLRDPPHPHMTVLAAGGEQAPVGRERHRADSAPV